MSTICVFESVSFPHFTEVRELHKDQAALMFIDEHERGGRTSTLHVFSSVEEGERKYTKMVNEWNHNLRSMKEFFNLDEG